MTLSSSKYTPEVDNNTFAKAINNVYSDTYIGNASYIDLMQTSEKMRIHEHFENILSKGQKNDIAVETMMLNALHIAFSDKDYGVDKNDAIKDVLEYFSEYCGNESGGMFNRLASTLADLKASTDPESLIDTSNEAKAMRYREGLRQSKSELILLASTDVSDDKKIERLSQLYEDIYEIEVYKEKFDALDQFYDEKIKSGTELGNINLLETALISDQDIDNIKRAIFKNTIIDNRLPVDFDKIDELYDRIISDDYNTTDMSLDETRYFGFRTIESDEDQAVLNKLDRLTQNLNRIGNGAINSFSEHKVQDINSENSSYHAFNKDKVFDQVREESKSIANAIQSINDDFNKIDRQNDITLDDYEAKDTRTVRIHPYDYILDPLGFLGKLATIASHHALKSKLGENGIYAKSFVPYAPGGYSQVSNEELGDYLDGSVVKDGNGKPHRASFDPVDSILNSSELNDNDKKNALTHEIASGANNLQVKNNVIARSNINLAYNKLDEAGNLLRRVDEINKMLSNENMHFSQIEREILEEEMARKMDKTLTNMQSATETIDSLKRARPDFLEHYARLEFADNKQLLDQLGLMEVETEDGKTKIVDGQHPPLDKRFSRMSFDEREEILNFYKDEGIKNKLDSLNKQASNLIRNTDLLDNYQRGKGNNPEAAQELKEDLKKITDAFRKSMEDIAKSMAAVFQVLGGPAMRR